MCGICGCFGPAASKACVARMLARMPHRGPDGEGSWETEGIALGHRRLAIVDLSEHGRQPMLSDDGQFVVAVNGEIYNYPELRRELQALGARCRSNCDSEIVLQAYRVWGTGAFARLNGMFAFALWDAAQQRLFLARDRMGIKPLYYIERDGGLAFASEIRALMAAFEGFHWTIDPVGLGQYLRHQNLIGSQSLFAGVRMLKPGYYLAADHRGLTLTPFWQPRVAPVSGLSFEAAVDQFRATFAGAVERHLMSDVPVASYLSAGFDSTMVATQAAQLMREPPSTFTGRFVEGGWYDEVAGARLVARQIGAQFTKVTIGAEDFRDAFDDVIWSLEEPRMGIGALPQFLVARAAAASRKVILTGHGGDELFSGYPVFKLGIIGAALQGGGAVGLPQDVSGRALE